jgi:hypothetical protein
MAQSGEFRREGLSPRCPICNNAEWAGGDTVARLPVTKDAADLPTLDDAAAATPFVCTRCGFVRLHDVRYLD